MGIRADQLLKDLKAAQSQGNVQEFMRVLILYLEATRKGE